MGALALFVLLAQIGCGSDPLCPLGTVGSSCELSGELGPGPDVPVGADSASGGSTAEDIEDAAGDQEVDSSDTQLTDGSSGGTEDASEVSDDPDVPADGAGDQTPDTESSDDDGDQPGDGARLWELELRPPGSLYHAPPPGQLA